jgi:hypothetical protein
LLNDSTGPAFLQPISSAPRLVRMSDKSPQGDGADDKHEAARHMAEAAMRAEAAGDVDQAASLLDQAEKTDPTAVVETVSEYSGDTIPTAEDDTELSTASETVVPGSDAPSRAGITGSGSGADNQGL